MKNRNVEQMNIEVKEALEIVSEKINFIETESNIIYEHLLHYSKTKDKLNEYDHDFVTIMQRDLSVTYPDWVFYRMPSFIKLKTACWLMSNEYLNEQVINDTLEALTDGTPEDIKDLVYIKSLYDDFSSMVDEITIGLMLVAFGDALDELSAAA